MFRVTLMPCKFQRGLADENKLQEIMDQACRGGNEQAKIP